MLVLTFLKSFVLLLKLVMGSRLFSYGDVKGRPSRAGFDLSKKFCFTAKAGQLLPVYWKMLLPGTKVNLKDMHFTRTMPVNTAAYTRIKEYFDWYFVPLRLINKNLNPALVNMLDQSNIATSLIQNKVVSDEIPYTNFSTITGVFNNFEQSVGDDQFDAVGFKRIPQSIKLMRHLRYGNFLYDTAWNSLPDKNMGYSSVKDFNLYAQWDLNVNILPLAAYQKIYCDYFRFEQWEKAQPYTYNFDYYSGGNILTQYESDSVDLLSKDNLFSLRYANYPRDLFMGILPSSQLGSVATVSLLPETLYTKLSMQNGSLLGTVASDGTTVTLKNNTPLTPGITPSVVSLVRNGDLKFDILSFRIANAIQRMREIQQCAGQGYKEQLEARWNVKLSTALSDHCMYIGGNSSQINISEVLNNNLAIDQAQAEIKGKGVGSGSGSESFETQEHGILMCIYHAVPVLDYELSGPDLQLLNTYATDLPQPELDNLGLESLPLFTLINRASNSYPNSFKSNTILGYVPRYIAYKTDVDCIEGAFLTSLTSWVAPLTIDEIVLKITLGSSTVNWSPNYVLFKVSPRVLNSIFVSQCDDTIDTDQFLVESFFDVKVVQNLDYDGMPY
nr:MAG TPA: Major capsid protein [Microviridae sp.]